MRRSWLALVAVGLLMLSGCGYNTLQTADEQTKSAWSEVLNQYQRRADLVPNLVETVKAFAKQEMDVLTRVTEARARVGSVQASPDLVENPEAFRRLATRLTCTPDEILYFDDDATYVAGAREAGLWAHYVGGAAGVRTGLAVHGLGALVTMSLSGESPPARDIIERHGTERR